MSMITAVVTCFNQYDTIRKTIKSLLNQIKIDLEVILVDDGSDNQTKKILYELCNDYKKIILLELKHGHVSKARNEGIKKAKNEYVFVADGDDFYEPELLFKCKAILDKKPEVGIVSSWVQTIGHYNTVIKPVGGTVINFIALNHCPGQALIRKCCWKEVGGYDTSMKSGYEDWEFYLHILKKGWVAKIVKEPLINYTLPTRKHGDVYIENRLQCYKYILEKHIDIVSQNIIDCILEKENNYQKRLLQDDDVFIGDGSIEKLILETPCGVSS